jgi:hypothetical protein
VVVLQWEYDEWITPSERSLGRLPDEDDVVGDAISFLLRHEIEVQLVPFVCDDVGEVQGSLEVAASRWRQYRRREVEKSQNSRWDESAGIVEGVMESQDQLWYQELTNLRQF